MANGQLNTVVRHIHRLAGVRTLDDLSDGQLLEQFTSRHEEAAFAVLVRRHGPMVLGVCRRVLRDSHAAEDAFQATFLVLFRRARFLDRRASVANWLYTVAYHAALRARADADRRHRHERQVVNMARTTSRPEEFWGDLQPVLDEELNQLPDKYRSAVVLCHLQGKTTDEAAGLLRCPAGTVKSRLARARELLRSRLTRRGISLSAGILATVLAERATAAVPAVLGDATVNMVMSLAAGQAAGVAPAALAEGVLKAIFVAKLKIATALLLAVGAVGFGVVACAREALAQRQGERAAPAGASPARSQSPRAAPAKETKAEENKTITVRARVLNPDGKPVPGAQVAVLHLPKRFWESENEAEFRFDVLAEARADGKGRVRLKVPLVPAPPRNREIPPVAMAAAAKGYGLGLRPLDLKADAADVEVRLKPERVLRLRFIDLQGAPVRGLRIPSYAVIEKKAEPIVALLTPAQPLSLWPGTLITDAQGRCVLRGTGCGQTVFLMLRDHRFAPKDLEIGPAKKGGREEITTALTPAHVVEGRITYADTGKPVAGAAVDVQHWARIRTDKDGRYRLSPRIEPRYGPTYAHFVAPAGEPYMGVSKVLDKPKGGAKLWVDVALPRAVLVRGKVAEAGSGKPVAGAAVYFLPQVAHNPFYRDDVSYGRLFGVNSKADGSFQIPILPGPGWLVAEGRTPEYVLIEASDNRLYQNRPGGGRSYVHGLLRTELKARPDPQSVTITFHRGVSVKGKVVGQDGKAADGVRAFSRLLTSTAIRFANQVPTLDVPTGGFEIKACDPEKPHPVIFLDERNACGAFVRLSGKDAGTGPMTVRLARCGAAVARFLNSKGKPLAGYRPQLEMLFAPGPYRYDFAKTGEGEMLAADSVRASDVYAQHYRNGPNPTDAQGRCTLPCLIPGVTYRIWWQAKNGVTVRDFSVKPGETVDLKDITMPLPQ